MADPAPIPVQPVEGDGGLNSITIAFYLRIAILDAATGQPVTDAYAEKPTVDTAMRQMIDNREVHPFRVLQDRTVTFSNSGFADFDLSVRNLKTWVEDASSTPQQKKLKLDPDWKCTGEFIHEPDTPEVLSGTQSTFVKIHADDDRYVVTQSGQTTYAQRDLITNRKGVLEIPITFSQWWNETKIKVKLRDYLMVKAEGDLEPSKLIASETAAGQTPSLNGYKMLNVVLNGQPSANDWKAGPAASQKTFQDEIEFTPGDWWGNADATVWVVRRVIQASTLVPAGTLPNATGSCSRVGIMIHYNSGYYMNEKRGTATRLCREAFTNHENDYFGRVAMALMILKRINDGIGPNAKLGYHIHLERNGTICLSADEARNIWHAGESREDTAVTALENVTQNPRTASPPATFNQPREGLNSKYVGVDLLGYHSPNQYHYTDRQLWYLDRLIANLMARNANMRWYTIQGHDEVREAYRAVHGANSAAVKSDPGTAIDGMDLLRGRHGATFPPPPPAGGAPMPGP